ncbi:MAG: S46 family peptidase [Bacteroidia bacterium]|nr:S46 family peptidase [Bacteroidia bacterium]MCZ2248963.1 S46 family peptidase [Bacteroidia bacterium]
MKKIFLILIGLSICTSALRADEGMWLPLLLKSVNEADMQAKGCKLSAEEIFSINKTSLKDAIVLFGGGCTGEIISDQGLLLTNHHCGYGQIQKLSTLENDYVRNGYWAMNKEQELICKGLSVTFILSMKDVTEQILSGINSDFTEEQREAQIKSNTSKLLEGKPQGPHYNTIVRAFYYGNQYYMFTTETFTDIRFVGAPPESIGKFGSDTDNWMWPRHTGDFSLFRIYANAENKPADYDSNNKPFKPRYYFPISLKELNEGEFTMVYGFPGRTNEYLPSHTIKMIKDVSNPVKIKLREKRIEVMDEFMLKNDTLKLKYTAKQSSVANAYKKWQGEQRGIDRLNVLNVKQAEENEFLKRAITKNYPEAKTILINYELLHDKYNKLYLQRDYYNEALRGIELINVAILIEKKMKSLDGLKDNKQAIAKEQESIKEILRNFYKDYDKRVDRLVFERLMKIYYDDMNDKIPSNLFEELVKNYDKDVAKWSMKVYEKTILNNPEKLYKLIEELPGKNRTLQNDPIFKISSRFGTYFNSLNDQLIKMDAEMQALNRNYMYYQMKLNTEKKFYPDANSTLRVAYGKVEGYKPIDGVVYKYYSTLEGVMEKEDKNNPEFFVDPKLKQLFQQKDYGRYADKEGKMRIAFIASNHTTGGNSGSPVLNANGELIGTNFDRNWEGTVSDIKYDVSIVRNICVDIHYTLFIIEKFAGAKHLIDEMKIIE